MIKNIVFDIGNVLVTFHPKNYFQAYFGNTDKCEFLCNMVFQHSAWERYDQGIYQMEDLERIYKESYPKEYDDIAYILTHWLGLMHLMEESYRFFKELRGKGFQLYLLSNISKDSADYLKARMPFFEEVMGEVLSYQVKSIKPDAKIYEELFRKYNLIAEETIFLDDNLKNIEQAQRMGIHAIQFLNIENVRNDVYEKIEKEKFLYKFA